MRKLFLFVSCFLLLYLYPIPYTLYPTYASHQPFTEGWYCVENELWHDIPDQEANHELLEDCSGSGKICTLLEIPEGYNSNAECLPGGQEEEQNPTPKPPTVPGPSVIPISPEEQAIYNLNQGLLPKEVIREKPTRDKDFLDLLKELTATLVDRLLFFQQPANIEKVYAQSEAIQQSEIPTELKLEGQNPVENLKGFLGGHTGFYGVSLPQFPGIQSGSIRETEKLYEKSHFPERINPITQ